jgi:predicted RNA binding protein YcfA (HicA-like mRNA interferase family)
MNHEAKQLAVELESKGWVVTQTRGGHFKATYERHIDRPMVFFAKSPSDHRAFRNVRAIVRRIENGGTA